MIGLRDSEVEEISRTGQLTTTKMGQQTDHIKRLNGKLAGATVKNEETSKEREEINRQALLQINPNYDSLTKN